MKYLFFDTETSGLPDNYQDPPLLWPRLVQLGFILWDDRKGAGQPYIRPGRIDECNVIVRPEPGVIFDESAVETHGISLERALAVGKPLEEVMIRFGRAWRQADMVVCHNYNYDSNVIDGESLRLWGKTFLNRKPHFCTMLGSKNYCKLPGRYGDYKWPRLEELHRKLFGESFEGAHDAFADIQATVRCFFELKERGIILKDRTRA